MKLRPVLLVILLLSGFYYVNDACSVERSVGSWLHRAFNSSTDPNASSGTLRRAAESGFDLTQANAAPAFDTEEQQNIAVYKKALPSVVNITSTEMKFDFFYGPVPQQGQGSGFVLNKDGLIITNNHVIGNAQKVEVNAVRPAHL